MSHRLPIVDATDLRQLDSGVGVADLRSVECKADEAVDVALREAFAAIGSTHGTQSKESEMLSQPDAPISNDDSSNELKRTETDRHKDDSLPTRGSIETEKEALRNFRERLKRSTYRPRWWADHMRSFFR
jgi:hypothetical protein